MFDSFHNERIFPVTMTGPDCSSWTARNTLGSPIAPAESSLRGEGLCCLYEL